MKRSGDSLMKRSEEESKRSEDSLMKRSGEESKRSGDSVTDEVIIEDANSTQTDDFQFNNDEILQYIIDSVHCAICMSIMPECIGCIHCTVLFCEDCVNEMTSETNKGYAAPDIDLPSLFGRAFNCPNCKQKSITIPNTFVQKLIGRFTIKCIDCEQELPHAELKRHMNVCPNKPTFNAIPDTKNSVIASQIDLDHQLALRLARENEKQTGPLILPQQPIVWTPQLQPRTTQTPFNIQPNPEDLRYKRSKAMDNLMPPHLRIYPQTNRPNAVFTGQGNNIMPYNYKRYKKTIPKFW